MSELDIVKELRSRAYLADVVHAKQDALTMRTAAAEIERLRAERDQLNAAIVWALGYEHFPMRQDGQGAYWWRKELRRRATPVLVTPQIGDD